MGISCLIIPVADFFIIPLYLPRQANFEPMKKLLFTSCCIAAFAMNSFTQNITTGSQNQSAQFVPQSFEDNFCLIHTNCLTLKEANQTAEKIHEAGGRIAVIGSPEFMVGWIPAGIRETLTQEKNIQAIFSGSYDLKNINQSSASTAIINYFNSVLSGELFQNEQEASQNYFSHGNGCMFIEKKNSTHDNNELSSRSICEKDKNSEYLKGSVSCGVFFVESNGAVDPNTYTWTSLNITNLKNQIIDAFSIWAYTASQNGISVTFTPVWYEAPSTIINQPYEPILHPASDDGLWVSSILGNLGYNTGDKFTDTHSYNWDLRNTNGTNWAYSAFVINNPSPAPTGFTDGPTSYAYKGGPYCMMLLRASGWPTNTFFRAFGHESTHIFNAFDEYSSSDPNNCFVSFNGVVNTNYQGSPCFGPQSCLMIDNTYFGTGSSRQWYLCNATKSHIGWQNLAPAPTLVSPGNNAGVSPGIISFTWNRNTSNSAINSLVRITDTLNNIIDCSVVGVTNNSLASLGTGVYKWQVLNGTDSWDGGYAEVPSPANYLFVGMNGIDGPQGDLTGEIFPNPAADQITIQNLQAVIKLIAIYDLAGHKNIFIPVTRVIEPDSFMYV